MKNLFKNHWLLIVSISFLFVLSSCAAGLAPQVSQTVHQTSSNNAPTTTFTHTVFAEDATATWCGHCPYAHGSLWRIYNIGHYPMYYTALVCDKNTHAAARAAEYNLYGYPTVFFDGGYQVDCGSYDNWQQQMSWYNQSIGSCAARSVPNIWTTLNVNWLGNAAMDIHVSVQNNDTAPYAGHIRVFVTEVNSSMGWVDTQGKKYTFPFLDYAFNEEITVASSSTWSDSITWDGHNYNDGYGHTFGSIQLGNIAVLAAVYNETGHTQYAYPPSSNPFQAHYVDDATGVLVAGAPEAPATPPAPSGPGSGLVNIGYNFTATTTDPQNDQIYYLFDFGDGTDSGWTGPYASGASATVTHAWSHKGTFNIKVMAKDIAGHTSNWSPTHAIVISASTITLDVKASKGTVAVTVTNPGSQDLSSLAWSIHVYGGLFGFLDKHYNGTIDSLPAGQSTTVSSGKIFGLGPIRADVLVAGTAMNKQGFVIGPFLILR